jgi:hypothetical protein
MAVCSQKFAFYSNCCDGRSEISGLDLEAKCSSQIFTYKGYFFSMEKMKKKVNFSDHSP